MRCFTLCSAMRSPGVNGDSIKGIKFRAVLRECLACQRRAAFHINFKTVRMFYSRTNLICAYYINHCLNEMICTEVLLQAKRNVTAQTCMYAGSPWQNAHATLQMKTASEICARDWLTFANQVHNDTTIEISSCFCYRQLEVVQINRARERGRISNRQVTTIGHEFDYASSETIWNR